MELWHVSEDPGIARFEPHRAATASDDEPRVWAIDTPHLPLYWFPRDCPRAAFWAGPGTTDDDLEAFLDGDRTRRVHALQGDWLDRFRSARVYAYRLPAGSFELRDANAGYWISRSVVEPVELVELGDLLARHAEAGVELRIAPSLYPLWDKVIETSLDFSGIRLRNAVRP